MFDRKQAVMDHEEIEDLRDRLGYAYDDREALIATRERFGGADVGAQFGGGVAAIGATVLLAGFVTAATNLGYQLGIESDAEDVTVGGIIAGGVVLFFALLAGGWVAGRMSRYDGPRNGFFAGVWFLVVLGIVTATGAWIDESYDFLDEVRLPDWLQDNLTTAAIVSAVVLAAVCLFASTLGGSIGARYHRNPDALLLSHRGTYDRDRTVVRRRDDENRDVVVDDGVHDGDDVHRSGEHFAGRS